MNNIRYEIRLKGQYLSFIWDGVGHYIQDGFLTVHCADDSEISWAVADIAFWRKFPITEVPNGINLQN
jgi:hypothetical protein